MDRFERRAKAIMERGDRIIADRQKKSVMIRRVSYSVSGLCAAALIAVGIWKSPALHHVPDIPQYPDIETVTTATEEETSASGEPATEVSTEPVSKPETVTKTTAVSTDKKNTTSSAAATSAVEQSTQSAPAVTGQSAVQSATEAVTTTKSVQSATEPAATKAPEPVTGTVPTAATVPVTEAMTTPPLQCPTFPATEPIIETPVIATEAATAAQPVTAPATQPETTPATQPTTDDGGANWESGSYQGGGSSQESPVVTGLSGGGNTDHIYLQTTEDDPYGIKGECRKAGVKEIAPSYIMDGFKLIDLSELDTWSDNKLFLTYCRERKDTEKDDYLHLKYVLNKQNDNPTFRDSFMPSYAEDAVEKEINGYTFRYMYEAEERLLRAEYIDGGFTFSIMIEGLTQHGAERILNSIS